MKSAGTSGVVSFFFLLDGELYSFFAKGILFLPLDTA
jgi:hypothetical protein